ncbi:unnamed protein product [Penicillium palitans]
MRGSQPHPRQKIDNAGKGADNRAVAPVSDGQLELLMQLRISITPRSGCPFSNWTITDVPSGAPPSKSINSRNGADQIFSLQNA